MARRARQPHVLVPAVDVRRRQHRRRRRGGGGGGRGRGGGGAERGVERWRDQIGLDFARRLEGVVGRVLAEQVRRRRPLAAVLRVRVEHGGAAVEQLRVQRRRLDASKPATKVKPRSGGVRGAACAASCSAFPPPPERERLVDRRRHDLVLGERWRGRRCGCAKSAAAGAASSSAGVAAAAGAGASDVAGAGSCRRRVRRCGWRVCCCRRRRPLTSHESRLVGVKERSRFAPATLEAAEEFATPSAVL